MTQMILLRKYSPCGPCYIAIAIYSPWSLDPALRSKRPHRSSPLRQRVPSAARANPHPNERLSPQPAAPHASLACSWERLLIDKGFQWWKSHWHLDLHNKINNRKINMFIMYYWCLNMPSNENIKDALKDNQDLQRPCAWNGSRVQAAPIDLAETPGAPKLSAPQTPQPCTKLEHNERTDKQPK